MDNLINNLISVLGEEADIYCGVLKISKDKTTVIIEGRVNDLEKLVKLEQSCIMQLSKLESDREGLISKVSALAGTKPEDITISGLMENVKDEQKEALKELQDRIVNVIGELKNMNDLNSRLIKNSLDYINFSLGLFTDMGSEGNNYDTKAARAPKKNRNLFDLKV